MLAGRHEDNTVKVDITLNDPLDIGLSVNLQGFSIGSDYVAIMAARRESDVLLTEGHDPSFAFPGPSNASYGVFRGNATRIGYGGWTSEAQQVATINVDNEFTDFDEPFAETAIGWKGITVNPVYGNGSLDVSGEYSYITYNTNWQAYGDPDARTRRRTYPTTELDTGVGHNFRTAFQPFQDKQTHIAVLKGKLRAGRRPAASTSSARRSSSTRRTSASTTRGSCRTRRARARAAARPARTRRTSTRRAVHGGHLRQPERHRRERTRQGYQWKPFDSLSDDDRLLRYYAFTAGAGYQVSDDLYASLSYTKYLADLFDGNTAFQAYNLHEMASGFHNKNSVVLRAKYILAGVEFGAGGPVRVRHLHPVYHPPQHGLGLHPPVRGRGAVHVAAHPGGIRGVRHPGRRLADLESRFYSQLRMKAFMKAQF